jgi:hypothetical protein
MENLRLQDLGKEEIKYTDHLWAMIVIAGVRVRPVIPHDGNGKNYTNM